MQNEQIVHGVAVGPLATSLGEDPAAVAAALRALGRTTTKAVSEYIAAKRRYDAALRTLKEQGHWEHLEIAGKDAARVNELAREGWEILQFVPAAPQVLRYYKYIPPPPNWRTGSYITFGRNTEAVMKDVGRQAYTILRRWVSATSEFEKTVRLWQKNGVSFAEAVTHTSNEFGV